jgi:hemerythrin-like domain-containing protein
MTTEAPADPADMYMVHDVFRREITLEPELVRGVAAGDVERAETIARHIELVHDMLHHHHSTEDAHVWPKLHERGGADVEAIVHVMENQHRNVDALNSEITVSLATWRTNADPAVGVFLADKLAELSRVLREHLVLEEAEVLPLITKYLTAREWSEAVSDAAATTDPQDLPLMFGLVMYEGDPKIIDETVAHMPPEVQPVIRDIAGKAYAEHSRRVHGTSTPKRSTELV